MGVLERFSLVGRRALVTGASRGIGRAIAESLAEAGADVAVVGRSEQALNDTAGAIQGSGRRTAVCPADLACPDSVPGVVERAENGIGPIDLLVHAAGVTVRVDSASASLADYHRVMQVNVTSAMQLAQAVGRQLLRRKSPGSMVFICSLMSSRARPTVLHYTMSKTALVGLIRTLAVEWAAAGIRVNGLAPGYVRTELTRPLQEDSGFNQWVVGRTPAGRWAGPVDIAPAAVFLASDAAGFITGQVINVDGGWTAAL